MQRQHYLLLIMTGSLLGACGISVSLDRADQATTPTPVIEHATATPQPETDTPTESVPETQTTTEPSIEHSETAQNKNQGGDDLTEVVESSVDAIIPYSYLRINAIGPGGELADARVSLGKVEDEHGELRNSRGEPIPSSLKYHNPDGSGDSTAPLSDGATIIDLRPGTYTVQIRYTNSVLHFRSEEAGEHTLTAVVEEGQETVVTVGTGSFTMISDGVPADYVSQLALYGQWEGEWKHIEGCRGRPVCATLSVELEFGKQIWLAPGTYRIMDFGASDEGVVIAEFTIDIGKEVTVNVVEAD